MACPACCTCRTWDRCGSPARGKLDYDARRFVKPLVRARRVPAGDGQRSRASSTGSRWRRFTRSCRASRRIRSTTASGATGSTSSRSTRACRCSPTTPPAIPCCVHAVRVFRPGRAHAAAGRRTDCLDLVRMTLDRYLAGAKGYGQVGYACEPTDADLIPWKTPWTSLDTLPSFLISACNYVRRLARLDVGTRQLRQARRVGPRDVRRRQGWQRPHRVPRHRQLRRPPAGRQAPVELVGHDQLRPRGRLRQRAGLSRRHDVRRSRPATAAHGRRDSSSRRRPRSSAPPTRRRF